MSFYLGGSFLGCLRVGCVNPKGSRKCHRPYFLNYLQLINERLGVVDFGFACPRIEQVKAETSGNNYHTHGTQTSHFLSISNRAGKSICCISHGPTHRQSTTVS
jgi:hypothetical protein